MLTLRLFLIVAIAKSCDFNLEEVSLFKSFLLKSVLVSTLLVLGLSGCGEQLGAPSTGNNSTQVEAAKPKAFDYAASDKKLKKAFASKTSDLQIRGKGKVLAILKDDLKGSRHQKFLLRLSHGQTILVAHNIDLAPRVKGIRKGDTVEFYGEYEWTAKGGVMHWTHHDPRGRHPDGWLRHNGKKYE